MPFHAFHKSNCPGIRGNVGHTLGFLATLVAVVAPLNAVPQIVTIFRNQSVVNVSLVTYLVVLLTQIVWLAYGIKLFLKPLVISSIVVVSLSGIIIFQFLLFG